MDYKYVSEFVKRNKALNSRLVMRLLWNSTKYGTYIKRKHGKLI